MYLQKCFLLLLFITVVRYNQINAQDTITFKNGLAIPSGSRYGREAIYYDILAHQMYKNMLSTPIAGKLMLRTEKNDSLIWRTVEADSNGRFQMFSRRSFERSSNPFLKPGAVDIGADYLYITYNSPVAKSAILNVQGCSGLYFNGVPHTGDPYSYGYMQIPVHIKKGLNEIYIRGANVLPRLIFPAQAVLLMNNDLTIPDVVIGEQNGILYGAITVVNTTQQSLNDCSITSSNNGREVTTGIAEIPALMMRKVIFKFDATALTQAGKYDYSISLYSKEKLIDTKIISINSVPATSSYRSTFISNMDGSLQYYAVTPQLNGTKKNAALFLSVHGAEVEAINQARAYKSKDWGTLVAATNRRPRGFNWEDWGRLDAIEVLDIAKKRFTPDEQKIYLTGHSMGGHGTWFLGATYPDKWAAIGAAAGYASLKAYGSADGKIPDSSKNPIERILLRAGNQSDVPKLATNYNGLGVYILHGDSDQVVSVDYARQMRKVLSDFHKDFCYYEYPGGEHWFGDQSVDWPPLFEYFKWHKIPEESDVNHIDFKTSSPGISASYRWATIYQQVSPLHYSRIKLKRSQNAITGNTENVLMLKLALSNFGKSQNINITIDSSAMISYTTKSLSDTIFLVKNTTGWNLILPPPPFEKNPERYGTFKEAFNHNMVFVVGTQGNKEENDVTLNKAKYDAETWYYRGNGSVDIITDKQYATTKYNDRNVILYGNASTNAAWKFLLKDCPIQLKRNLASVGLKQWNGDDIAAYFIWPQANPNYLTGVVAATGIKGMKAAYANQYFAGGSGFPDFMLFTSDMLKYGATGIKLAGFYNNKWQLDQNQYISQP